MTVRQWRLRLALVLFVSAIALYAVRWFAFDTPALHDEMWRFLVGDVGFLFVQVLLVSLVLDNVMQRRQHEEMLNKLNMVIGAFFSEAGTDLLGMMAKADTNAEQVRDNLVVSASWNAGDYARALAAFASHQPRIELEGACLEVLKERLAAERSFLIGMLGNQNLLEHESFTDLLWAITHLGEELSLRGDLSRLPPADHAHVLGDMERAYGLLGSSWLRYLQHLQAQYPYLFSLAMRTNPLDTQARVTVQA